MKHFRFVWVILILTMSATIAFAQDTSNSDGWQDKTSNWCDEGGVWGPEFCASDYLAPSEWKWQYGWWWQRVIEGDIPPSMIPGDYYSPVNISPGSSSAEFVEVVIQSPSGPVKIIIVLTGGGSTHPSAPTSGTVEVNSNDFNAGSHAAGIYADTALVIYGNANANNISGSSQGDTIYGGDGNDMIAGGGGDDIINGEGGNDTLFGNAGADTINGGADDDRLGAADGVTAITVSINPPDGSVDQLDGGTGTNACNYSAAEDTASNC